MKKKQDTEEPIFRILREVETTMIEGAATVRLHDLSAKAQFRTGSLAVFDSTVRSQVSVESLVPECATGLLSMLCYQTPTTAYIDDPSNDVFGGNDTLENRIFQVSPNRNTSVPSL